MIWRIDRDAWLWVAPLLIVAIIAATLAAWIAVAITLTLAVAVAIFFRDPMRRPPDTPGVIISAADGIVCAIEPAVPPGGETLMHRISVYLNLFNVHITRAPVAGRVIARIPRDGRHGHAGHPAASDRNTQLALHILTAAGETVVVAQVVGRVARRIVCRASVGDTLACGQRIGLIRFGSRTDVYLPPGTRPAVTVGSRVRGGETVLATSQ